MEKCCKKIQKYFLYNTSDYIFYKFNCNEISDFSPLKTSLLQRNEENSTNSEPFVHKNTENIGNFISLKHTEDLLFDVKDLEKYLIKVSGEIKNNTYTQSNITNHTYYVKIYN